MAVSLRGYGGATRQSRREEGVKGYGRIRLSCSNPPLNAVMYLGPDPPKLSGGFGGWETTPRPRAVGMTTWSGVPPFVLELNVLLGRQDLDAEVSVERRIRRLIDVARGTEDHPPGIVFVDGIPGLPADRWVIDGLDFGDVIRDRDMERIRQVITISLLEYQPPEYETLRRGSLARARPKVVKYTVKKGDTPAKIARNHRCKWTDIREVNRKGLIKKANQDLKDGSKINVPMKRPEKKPKKKRPRRHPSD